MLNDENKSAPQEAPIFPFADKQTDQKDQSQASHCAKGGEEIIYPEVKLQSGKRQSPYSNQTIKNHSAFFRPETWRCLQIFPPKYRRLSLVVFILLFVFILLALLKPQGSSIQSFDNDNTFQLDDTDLNTQAVGDLSSLLETNASSTENNLPQDQSTPLQKEKAEIPAQAETSSEQDMLPPSSITVDANQDEQYTEMPFTQPSKTAVTSPADDVFTAAEKANLLSTPSSQPTPLTSHSEKVLIVRKGVSLMQLFRENQLKVSDVMAMSRVPNAGQRLNRLAPQEKVKVYLTTNGNVKKMVLPDGGYFVRENNSYRFYR